MHCIPPIFTTPNLQSPLQTRS
uniref:Uncharacterized protein n=1 Tax=Physcomitrium patens TaxID=3218 RepID=A0A2K1IWU9_PHYPA|nr:hypothetical protein PHYPA_023569 [Physcomitrium patens]